MSGRTPRVLKDGSDSVGTLRALNRVFINIGLFGEEWLEHFRPLVGARSFTPFVIAVADKNSSCWKATEAQTPDLALFFLASARPDRLKEAPGGKVYLTTDQKRLTRDKVVFAEWCARCHSSKLPEQAFRFFPNEDCVGPHYLKCWNDYWAWTKTTEFERQMTRIALADDFLQDNFPSQPYKSLPSVSTITVHHPVTGVLREYTLPAGGRGFIRPASLISLWSTAPFCWTIRWVISIGRGRSRTR